MFEFSLGLSKHILSANMADTASIEHQRQRFFQPIRCSQDMSCSLSSGNKTSKTSTFEVPKIFSEFFSPSFRWVLPVAWPRAAAPEAGHRCSWQPSSAAIPWSSGSSRRRRPWMHRTKRAVASEEDICGET